jgi:lauroyl/myristoyl acyltransferase
LLALLRAGASLSGVLPGPVSRRVAEAVGVAAARLPVPAGTRIGVGLSNRRAVVASHLRRVYGPSVDERGLAGGVDAAFASYARYWAESLRLPSLTAAQIAAGVELHGFHHVDDALAGGRGLVVAMPHLGGWEWGGTYIADRGYGVSVVVEALRSSEVFDWFASFRRRLGMEVIPAGPGAAGACLRALASNRILCLLSDRVVGATLGVHVELFGATTRLPAGPVTLALRTGAPIVAAAVYFGAATDGHAVVVRPPLALERRGRLRDDVAAGTQAMAAELEALIRWAPTQWHLMQPNWPGDEALLSGGNPPSGLASGEPRAGLTGSPEGSSFSAAGRRLSTRRR